MTIQELKGMILDVPDFPKPGVLFKDITPLLANPVAFRSIIDSLGERVGDLGASGILAIESRGFIFGAALAQRLALPLHLVRKRGKLPRESISIRYELEYGFDHLEVHTDAVTAGRSYLIVDDLIATGGTAAATAKLVRQQQASVASCAFVVELTFLNGREALDGCRVDSLISF